MRWSTVPTRPCRSLAQCRLLKVARSTLYYRPAPVSADDLAVMRRMDELHLAWPFYGSRRMAAVLRRDGWSANRKRVKRLMRVMGLEAIYQKPNTSQAHPGAQGVSVSVAGPGDRPAEPGVVRGHHLHSDGEGVRVSGGGDGLVQPAGSGMAGVDHHGHGVLRRGVAGGDGSARAAGDLQHRSRACSSPARIFSANWRPAGFGSAWMARGGIWTTSSSSGCGGA